MNAGIPTVVKKIHKTIQNTTRAHREADLAHCPFTWNTLRKEVVAMLSEPTRSGHRSVMIISTAACPLFSDRVVGNHRFFGLPRSSS